jgi:hypothetical protein
MRHIHWLLSFTFTQLCFGRLHELHLLSERYHSNSSEWNSNVTLSSLFRRAAFVPFTNALGRHVSTAHAVGLLPHSPFSLCWTLLNICGRSGRPGRM